MATQFAEAPRPVPTFDPAAWLSALISIGGGYALASRRKLRLVVEECVAVDIENLMRLLIGHPDQIEAVTPPAGLRATV